MWTFCDILNTRCHQLASEVYYCLAAMDRGKNESYLFKNAVENTHKMGKGVKIFLKNIVEQKFKRGGRDNESPLKKRNQIFL